MGISLFGCSDGDSGPDHDRAARRREDLGGPQTRVSEPHLSEGIAVRPPLLGQGVQRSQSGDDDETTRSEEVERRLDIAHGCRVLHEERVEGRLLRQGLKPIAGEHMHVEAGEQTRRGVRQLLVRLDRDERSLRAQRVDDPGGTEAAARAELGDPPARKLARQDSEQASDLRARRPQVAERGGERLGAVDELGGVDYDGVTL